MATTPIYAIPTPDLTSTADGPAATAAMASRIEAVMTKFITETNYNNGTAAYLGSNSSTVVHEVNLSTNIIGWLEIQLGPIWLGDPGGASNSAMAGNVRLYVNDILKRDMRYHSQSRTSMWVMSGIATNLAVSGAVSTNVKVRVLVDPVSNPVQFYNNDLSIKQYGTT